MSQDHFNLWVSDKKVPEKANALVLLLSGGIDKELGTRWRAIKGIAGRLCRSGFVATHVPINLRQKLLGDIVVLSTTEIDKSEAMSNLPKIEKGIIKSSDNIQISSSDFTSIFEGAWQDWFREFMRKSGFLLTGFGTYVATEQLVQSTTHKLAFTISPESIDGSPAHACMKNVSRQISTEYLKEREVRYEVEQR